MGKVEGYFDGDLGVRKADIIRIRKGILEGEYIRAVEIENVSAGSTQRSRIAGTLMTEMPVEFEPPLTGRVEGLDFMNKNTYFTLATGVFLEQNRFFPAGQLQAGQEAIRRLLRTEVRGYVKVVDPYTTPDTLDLLTSVSRATAVMVLCELRRNPVGLRKSLHDMVEALRRTGTQVEVRVDQTGELHDRYIVTDGAAWMLGHSLKDFGRKDTSVARLAEVRPLEEAFDRRWDAAEQL